MSGLLYWHWLIIGLVFVILEMFAPGAILLWFGIGAGLLGLILLLPLPINLPLQLLIFAFLSLLGLLVGRRYVRWRPIVGDKPNLSRRGEAYIGKSYRLLQDMDNGTSSVRIGDTDWRVEGNLHGEAAKAGSSVVVTGVEGASLQVTAA